MQTMTTAELQKDLRSRMFSTKLKDVVSGTGLTEYKIRRALNDLDPDRGILDGIKDYFDAKEQPHKKAS